MANRDKDDTHLSLINSDWDGFHITIFSGKVDFSLNIAQELASRLLRVL